MKFGHYDSSGIPPAAARRFFPLLALCLLLQGCAQLADFHFPGTETATQYKPLDSEIAAMAAPQPAGAAGPTVYCTAGKGSARFGDGKWYDFKDTAFALPPQGRVTINLPPKTGSSPAVSPFQGFFDEAGQKMVFCPIVSGAPDERIACASLYALDDDLKAGIKRTFDVPDALRGGAISCAYDPAHIEKL